MHRLSYKIVKDLGSYIVWEAKLSPFWRLILGLPFLLFGMPLSLSSLYIIYKKGYLPSLLVLITLLVGIGALFIGLAIVGSWRSLVLDGVMGTLTLCKYFLWRPSTKVYHFAGIEGLEISKTMRQFAEELPPQEYYEISLLYEGQKVALGGSTDKEEAEEFAGRIAGIVGREVRWS